MEQLPDNTFSLPPALEQYLSWKILCAGGGHQEDVTAGWTRSWTRAMGGSPPSPRNVCSACLPCPIPRSCPENTAVWCWDHLDSICHWTLLKPLYKLVRFRQADEGIYSSYNCPKQASYVPLLIKSGTCHSGGVCLFLPALLMSVGGGFRLHSRRLGTNTVSNDF